MLTIQVFAQLCQCTTQTLRYYDKINLLKPFYRQELTGYRFYLEKQTNDFFKIKELQNVGWTIKEIKNVLGKDDAFILEKLEEKSRDAGKT